MHERRKLVGQVSVDACRPLTWLRLVKIAASLWLADLFSQGLNNLQCIEGWAVYFPCVVFYVLKYCSENSWVGCNESFQRPSFERGFFPALGGHHPFSCAVCASLIVPTYKGPLCEPASKCASATR